MNFAVALDIGVVITVLVILISVVVKFTERGKDLATLKDKLTAYTKRLDKLENDNVDTKIALSKISVQIENVEVMAGQILAKLEVK